MNILELAKQAGMVTISYNETSNQMEYSAYPADLERFAALIREECAKRIEQCDCPECSDCAAAIRGMSDE